MNGRWLIGVVAVLLIASMSSACSSGIRPPETDYSADVLEAQISADNRRALDDLMSKFPNASPPDVEQVRVVSLDEWAAAIAECLSAEGYSATAQDGGLVAKAPSGQELPYAIAYYVCTVEYPIDPRQQLPLAEDQIRFLYEYYTKELTPCLKAEGYDVPDPPSMQTYISTYGQPGFWDPYRLIAESPINQQDWERINRLCTQTPAELYGG